MELRQIEYFLEVYKQQSYTRAAEVLYISQPTISVAIRKLEEELGVRLIDRDNKSIRITPAGERLVELGRRVLDDVGTIEMVMTELRTGGRRMLKVALPSTIGSWLWKIAFEEFPKKYPDIELELFDMGTIEIVNALRNDEMDVGFAVIGMASDEEIEVAPIRTGEMKFIVSVSHPLAKFSEITPDMFDDQLIIMYSEGTTYTERMFGNYVELAGVKPRVIHVREQSTVFDIVSQGLAVAPVLDDQISAIRDNPKIRSLRSSQPIRYQSGLIWRRNKYLSLSARRFIDYVIELRDHQT